MSNLGAMESDSRLCRSPSALQQLLWAGYCQLHPVTTMCRKGLQPWPEQTQGVLKVRGQTDQEGHQDQTQNESCADLSAVTEHSMFPTGEYVTLQPQHRCPIFAPPTLPQPQPLAGKNPGLPELLSQGGAPGPTYCGSPSSPGGSLRQMHIEHLGQPLVPGKPATRLLRK